MDASKAATNVALTPPGVNRVRERFAITQTSPCAVGYSINLRAFCAVPTCRAFAHAVRVFVAPRAASLGHPLLQASADGRGLFEGGVQLIRARFFHSA